MQALRRLGATFGIISSTAAVAIGWGLWASPVKADVLLETRGTLASGDAVLDDGSLYDQYTFSGSSGQQVIISLESTDFDPYLILLDPQGRRIHENDDISRSNRNSRLVVVLPSTGVYTVVANSYESGKNGSYAISIDLGNNQSAEQQAMAAAAIPEGTPLCHTAVANTLGELETGRNVAVLAGALQLRDRYMGVPAARPQGLQLALEGPASLSILFSTQLLTYLTNELVRDCTAIGAVLFKVTEANFERTFGVLPPSAPGRRGRASAGTVAEFSCAAIPANESSPALPLRWGQQVCL